MPLRPFLLIQSRDPEDLMRGHEVACFCKAMGIRADELRVVDALERLPTQAELDGAAGILFGGSGEYSCLDGHLWIERLVDFLRDEILPRSDRPTFAACFGFQLLVRASGGEMIRDPEHTELGTFDLTLTDAGRADPLFHSVPLGFAAQVGHQDRATRYGPGLTNLASSPLCPLHACKADGKPIWATQFHPELGAEDVRDRYYTYAAKYRPGVVDPAEHLAFERALRPTVEASTLLPAFVAWVRGQGKTP
jgi:GMP synthase (glutamine-hydrolysing)